MPNYSKLAPLDQLIPKKQVEVQAVVKKPSTSGLANLGQTFGFSYRGHLTPGVSDNRNARSGSIGHLSTIDVQGKPKPITAAWFRFWSKVKK